MPGSGHCSLPCRTGPADVNRSSLEHQSRRRFNGKRTIWCLIGLIDQVSILHRLPGGFLPRQAAQCHRQEGSATVHARGESCVRMTAALIVVPCMKFPPPLRLHVDTGISTNSWRLRLDLLPLPTSAWPWRFHRLICSPTALFLVHRGDDDRRAVRAWPARLEGQRQEGVVVG